MTAKVRTSSSLATAQIGTSGVLLVQYRLLKHGIESVLMTTDAGIDLVVYSPHSKRAVTVQSKNVSSTKARRGNGKAYARLVVTRRHSLLACLAMGRVMRRVSLEKVYQYQIRTLKMFSQSLRAM